MVWYMVFEDIDVEAIRRWKAISSSMIWEVEILWTHLPRSLEKYDSEKSSEYMTIHRMIAIIPYT